MAFFAAEIKESEMMLGSRSDYGNHDVSDRSRVLPTDTIPAKMITEMRGADAIMRLSFFSN